MNLVISQKHLFVKPTLDITTIFRRIIAILLWVHIASHAVFLNGPPITAIKVPNNSIVVDGRPDLIWKAIASRSGTKSTLKFDDYSKIVLLQADSIRNSDPTKYFQAPVLGSVDMFAAYDNTALYFFFLVNENTLFNPATLCTATNLWKANAPEVYVDPSPWSPDNYQAFFSADGTGLLNGTSPKTIQLDKPIFSKDSRLFFRNRLTPPDRFQIPASTPNGVLAVASQHSASDSLVVGVEMKIPFWTGTATDFGAGKSIFISWGYNHYPNGAKSTCDSTPIAYRWAM